MYLSLQISLNGSNERAHCMALVLGLTIGFIHSISAQDDFTVPIKCYYCFAPAVNSTCADPVNQKHDVGRGLEIIECDYGVCLKWTYYWNGKLHIRRTCSAKLRGFRIMMIDGVCRKERNDNGYLCMCGKNLCNTSCRIRGLPNTLVLQLMCLCLTIGFTRSRSL